MTGPGSGRGRRPPGGGRLGTRAPLIGLIGPIGCGKSTVAGVLADRGVHQLVAGERPARLADHRLQQTELGGREQQLVASHRGAVAEPINDHALALDRRARRVRLSRLPPPELAFDPLDQL